MRQKYFLFLLLLLLIPRGSGNVPVGARADFRHDKLMVKDFFEVLPPQQLAWNKTEVSVNGSLDLSVEIVGSEKHSDSPVNFAQYRVQSNGTEYSINFTDPLYYDLSNKDNYQCPVIFAHFNTEDFPSIYPYFFVDFSTVDASCILQNLLIPLSGYPEFDVSPTSHELTNKLTTYQNVTNLHSLITYQTPWADLSEDYSDLSVLSTVELGGLLTDSKVGMYFHYVQALDNEPSFLSRFVEDTGEYTLQLGKYDVEVLFDRTTGWLDLISFNNSLTLYLREQLTPTSDPVRVKRVEVIHNELSNSDIPRPSVRDLILNAPPLATTWGEFNPTAPLEADFPSTWLLIMLLPILVRRRRN